MSLHSKMMPSKEEGKRQFDLNASIASYQLIRQYPAG